MKILLVILLGLIFTVQSKATCIVIIIRDNKIYVSADSRSTIFFTDGKGKTDSIYKSICKINHVGNTYFTMAGHGDNLLPDIFRSKFVNTSNLLNSWNDFKVQAVSKLKDNLSYLKRTNPILFKSYLNKPLAQFSVFGFMNGQAYLTTCTFKIINSNSPDIQISANDDNSPVMILGFQEHLDKKSPPINTNQPVIQLEKEIIGYEMKFHQNHISLPVDQLELTNFGPNWISKKKNCN